VTVTTSGISDPSIARDHGEEDVRLSAPGLGAVSIVRTRLLGELRAARDKRIVSIVAPPGYGKTTTLAQWASDHRDPVPWITVDDGDNDPVELFSHVAQVLDRRDPLDVGAMDRLRAPGVPIHSLVSRLLVSASQRATPVRFVLDDVDRLTDRRCLDALSELIARLPLGGQAVIAGRGAVDLPLPRWRSQGGLSEVGIDELAFDTNETSEMLRQLGLDLTPAEIGEIHGKSEGWPAGIYLAGIAIARGKVGPGAIISGRDRYIAEYLEAEVLRPLDPEMSAFLRRTAILERFSGPIADAVAGVEGGGSILSALAKTNQLIVPLDAQLVWFRYHTLLREALLADLEREEPGFVPELHRRASVWFEDEGQPEEAIEQAFAAGDGDRAARLFGGVVLKLHFAGRTTTARRILNRFDRGQLLRDPWLATFGAWGTMLAGEVDVLDRMEALVDHATYDGPPPDGTASFESFRAMLRVFRSRGGIAGMQTNADLALAAEAPTSPFRAWALNCVALARMAAADDLGAADAFAGAVSAARAASATGQEQFALGGAAILAIAAGDWDQARSLASTSEQVISASHLESYPTTALTWAASARVAIHSGDATRANECLAAAAVLRPQLTFAMPWLATRSLLELARAHLAVCDPAGARAVLRQAEGILVKRPDLGPVAEHVRVVRRQLQDMPIGVAGGSTLTAAELRVLSFLPLHLTFKDIGERMGVKPSTVHTHAMSIYGKLGASSRTQAVLLAVEAGLLEA